MYVCTFNVSNSNKNNEGEDDVDDDGNGNYTGEIVSPNGG